MKARPFKWIVDRFQECSATEADHVRIIIPGPAGELMLPVITRGNREGTRNWSWNGDTEKPTLRPSIRTQGHDFVSHCWVSDGKAQFCMDTSHEMRGQVIVTQDN